MGVGAAASIFAADKQADAAKQASELQSNASYASLNLQKQMYDQNRADQEPWRQAGVGALSELGADDFKKDFTAADFQKDPGYDFRMQEGQKALERSAAAKGGLQSGGFMKALGRYGQDYASNEYSNAYNRFNADRDRRFGRLSQIAGFGTAANSANMQSGANYANQGSQSYMDSGNAAAAGRIGVGQAWAAGAQGVANDYQHQQDNAFKLAGSAGGMMMSDERAKKNVEPADSDIEELLSTIQAHSYEYKDPKHGAEIYASPMAQELEKTKLGRGLVVETPEGKMVDYGRAVGTVMAAQAYLFRKLQQLEAKGV